MGDVGGGTEVVEEEGGEGARDIEVERSGKGGGFVVGEAGK